jgi:hypothetical protein
MAVFSGREEGLKADGNSMFETYKMADACVRCSIGTESRLSEDFSATAG